MNDVLNPRPMALLLALLSLPACTGGASTLAPSSAPAARPAPVTPPLAGTTANVDPAAAQALGERLALQGNGRGAPACASCHGGRGEGNADTGIPRLAGLPAFYIAKQLQDYAGSRAAGGSVASEARPQALMTPVAQQLNDEERMAVARYFSTLAGPSSAAGGSAPVAASRNAAAGSETRGSADRSSQRARQLIEVGDNSLQVQACANCHGPGASGLPGSATPFLAGQHVRYLQTALQAWRSGERHNDPSGQMPEIARRLAPEDIDALLRYLR